MNATWDLCKVRMFLGYGLPYLITVARGNTRQWLLAATATSEAAAFCPGRWNKGEAGSAFLQRLSGPWLSGRSFDARGTQLLTSKMYRSEGALPHDWDPGKLSLSR